MKSVSDSLWPANVHVIGKDITRFHCALWPAMLMSAGLPLPLRVFGHGFVYRKNEETGEVQKLSKSLGNVVEPMELIEKFSAEGFRYYFMSQCPFGGDGEFSFERFADTYNSGLANNLGNLYSRILTMCLKYFDGRLEGADSVDINPVAQGPRPRRAGRARCASRSARSSTAAALQRIWRDVVDAANRYIQETEPFKLAKTDLGGLPRRPGQPGRLAAGRGDPDQAVPAAHGRDVLSSVQLRGDPGVGPGQLHRCDQPITGHDLRVTAPITGGKPAPLFPKIELRKQPPRWKPLTGVPMSTELIESQKDASDRERCGCHLVLWQS